MIDEEKFHINKDGSLRRQGYCRTPELIENYDLAISDKTQMWVCHHRLESHFSNGELRPNGCFLSKKELIALEMYYDRPASELIFMPKTEHRKLHSDGKNNPFYGKTMSETNKKKLIEISHSRKGVKRPDFHPNQNSINALKNAIHTPEMYKKNGERMKTYKWFTNGTINKRCKECPPGFVPGRTKH